MALALLQIIRLKDKSHRVFYILNFKNQRNHGRPSLQIISLKGQSHSVLILQLQHQWPLPSSFRPPSNFLTSITLRQSLHTLSLESPISDPLPVVACKLYA
jgi:hypothetical protein